MSSIWTIRRSTSDVKLAGLCGGVARHWGIDPVLVRVGWALLALSGGLGVILYAAGWLLVPADGRETAPAQDMFGDTVRRWPREVWVAIVVIACVAGFALFGGIAPFGIGPAIVVALVWYFGFYRKRAAAAASAPPPSAAVPPPPAVPFHYPGPPTPFTEAAEAWQRRVAEYQATQAATVPSVPPWSAPPPGNLAPPSVPASAYAASPADPVPVDPEQVQRAAFLATPDPVGLYVEPTGSSVPAPLVRPGQRLSARRLRWAALLALGLTMGGLGLADYLGVDITPTVYGAAALLVIGVTLVLATWLGRARGLLPIGTLLAVGVLGLAVTGSGLPTVATPPDLPGQTIAYTSPADFPANGDYKDVGTLRVDLAGLTLTKDATYQASVDLGSIVVTVPPEANVVVRYRADAGSVTAFGRTVANGTELDAMVSDPSPMRPTRPTLTLDLGVDVGSVQVRR